MLRLFIEILRQIYTPFAINIYYAIISRRRFAGFYQMLLRLASLMPLMLLAADDAADDDATPMLIHRHLRIRHYA